MLISNNLVITASSDVSKNKGLAETQTLQLTVYEMIGILNDRFHRAALGAEF